MMDIKTVVRSALINSSALIALVPADHILSGWPSSFADLPMISIWERNQNDDIYADNAAFSRECEIQIDVWQLLGVSTTAITTIVDQIMAGMLWAGVLSGDIGEPDNQIQHRTCVYRRQYIADDLD